MSWLFRFINTAVTAPPDVSIESLEPRRLLAGEDGFSAKIDFVPESSPQPAEGYLADVGHVYAERPSGLKYGWNTPNESWGRERDFSNQKWATFNHLADDGRWAIEVPNGTYRVYVAAGDAKYTNSNYRIDVEGELTVDKKPTKRKRFADGIAIVTVEDGALTVTSADGAVNNKICFIEIEQLISDAAMRVQWTKDGATPSPVARVDAAVTQVKNKLYVFGGYVNGDYEITRRVDILDLETGTWSAGRNLPGNAATTHAGVASDGSRFIYLVSGQPGGDFETATRAAFRYDIKHDKWDKYAKLPEHRFGGAMVFRNGQLHFFGGAEYDRVTPSAKHWVSNTRSRNPGWVEVAPLPRAADHIAGAVVNDTIYAIGGEHGHAGIHNNPPPTYNQHKDVYAYDPVANTWTRKADLPVASSHFEGATVVIGSKILIIGGYLEGGVPGAGTRVYDTIADTWTTLTPLPDARENAAAAYHDGRVFVTGGFSSTLGVTNSSYWGTLVGV